LPKSLGGRAWIDNRCHTILCSASRRTRHASRVRSPELRCDGWPELKEASGYMPAMALRKQAFSV
jgi:hypothetical protein